MTGTSFGSSSGRGQRLVDAAGGSDTCAATHEAILQRMADHAVREIPGAKYAGVTTAGFPAQLDTVVMTHSYAAVVDAIQQYRHQGPFLSAAWKRDVLRVNDLEADERWPAYRRDVLRSTPIRTVLSFRLFTTARSVGALMIYANEPNAFDRHAEEIGYVVATHTALAVGGAQPRDRVRHVLDNWDVVTQAKSVLMEQFQVGSSEAFQMLKRLSLSSSNDLLRLSQCVIDKARQL
ncbi:GAF domain-containing protein [Mycolicibacterium mucogenicum]|uniref:ANTAR domain-containing protein n=1 Tax=Mycolicibacterium mucogenicum TaxID=56689 RepID=A0A4R5WNC8_MYCMU|nr:GAF domain-containing protein [Mycolicibacterium mucogenicum]TDK92900.1 ANTAR domain-containing protein [Mycolicibacterium mucogenicum]